MDPLKAPGPDGFRVLFYQSYWDIVGDNVFRLVQQLWRGEVSTSQINHTYVTLIPKVRNPNSMVNFRPISLCIVIYKIFAKTLANHLKRILPSIVSDNHESSVKLS